MLERLLDRDGDDRVKIVPLDKLLEERGETGTSDKVSGIFDGRTGVRALVASVVLAIAPAAVAADPLPAEGTEIVNVASTAGSQDSTETAAVAKSPAEVDEPEIVIAIDPATNSLVVLGSPRELDRLTALADQVEDNLPEEGGIIRTVPLPAGIEAKTVASVVNQTLRMVVPAGGVRGDLSRRTMVIADPTTNSVIVTSREDEFPLVADLIASSARAPEAAEVNTDTLVPCPICGRTFSAGGEPGTR